MVQQNEMITLLVGMGAMLFVLINRQRIQRIPGSSWLFFSYAMLFTGWVLTVLESFFLPELTNLLEHSCYMISAVAAAGWCWTVLARGEGTR